MSWQCFMAERIDQVRHSLRRYGKHYQERDRQGPDPCPLVPGQWSNHNVSVDIGDYPPDMPAGYALDEAHEGDGGVVKLDHADPRWPTHCACGHVFTETDEWQYNRERIYRDPRDGAIFTLSHAPVGAMWYSYWYIARHAPSAEEIAAGTNLGFLSIHYWRDWYGKRPPLTVQLPHTYGPGHSLGHQWCVDQKANNGDGWVVTGEPPRITANPSILVPGYHSFLRDGVLQDDLEGRRYP